MLEGFSVPRPFSRVWRASIEGGWMKMNFAGRVESLTCLTP